MGSWSRGRTHSKRLPSVRSLGSPGLKQKGLRGCTEEGKREGCGPEAKELEAASGERPGTRKNSASKIKPATELNVQAGATSRGGGGWQNEC